MPPLLWPELTGEQIETHVAIIGAIRTLLSLPGRPVVLKDFAVPDPAWELLVRAYFDEKVRPDLTRDEWDRLVLRFHLVAEENAA